MNRIRHYTDEEIIKLLSNPNVKGVNNKSRIEYKNGFKLWAVYEKINNPEKTARQIFESAGFDMNILDERTPQKRILSWTKKYEQYGEEYFLELNKYYYSTKTKNSLDYMLKIIDDKNEKKIIIYTFDEV